MERQWWEFVLEHLSGGIRDSVAEAREQLLPTPPEVSPLWRATQDTPSQCPAMIWVCRWLFLGITSALLYGPLIWLHEIIFLKYGVRKDEKALMVYRFWNIKKVRKYSPSVGFCGSQGGGGTLVYFGRAAGHSLAPCKVFDCPPSWLAAEPRRKLPAPWGMIFLS